MFRKFRVHFSVMTSYRTALRAGLQMAHRPSLLICIANDDNWIVIIHFIYLYQCNWISSLFLIGEFFHPPAFGQNIYPYQVFAFCYLFQVHHSTSSSSPSCAQVSSHVHLRMSSSTYRSPFQRSTCSEIQIKLFQKVIIM